MLFFLYDVTGDVTNFLLSFAQFFCHQFFILFLFIYRFLFIIFLYLGLAPLVLRGACPKCTESETIQIKKTLAHLQKNFPAQWNKLIQTYNG